VIHRRTQGDVAILQIEHGKVNALDAELLEDLDLALKETLQSPARAIVLTGTGSSFSAGVDLWRIVNDGAEYARRFVPLLERAFHTLFVFPRPVVVAVNGHAIAGGAILSCAADRSLMAAGRGRVGIPELRVGVPFPALALEIVRFALGERGAQETVISGATWGPEEAAQRGFVDTVVEPESLLETACAAAEDLSQLPAEAFSLVKQQLRTPALERAAAVARASGDAVLAAWCDPASHATIRAYLERTLGKRSG
jgi:enoyl-CoA hydratase